MVRPMSGRIKIEILFEESKNRHNNKKKTVSEQKRKRAKSLLSSYRYRDKKKFGVSNDLDEDWFIDNILTSRCKYCGDYHWNNLGCDRIDNSKPHTKDNVICCCTECNRMRSDKFTVEEFKKIGKVLKDIYKSRKNK